MPYSNQTELAWSAGFFDGEGCACAGRHRSNNQKPYPQVKIAQSGDLGHELLDRFNKAIGQLGKVYGPKPPGKNQTLIRYEFYANGLLKMKKIADLLWPYLGTVKRNQFQNVVDTCFEQRSQRRA